MGWEETSLQRAGVLFGTVGLGLFRPYAFEVSEGVYRIEY